MPKLSELPPTTPPLTGLETTVIVQSGETRHVLLYQLLEVPRASKIDNARWIQSTDALGTLLNSATMELSTASSGGC
ncbi:MAG: hypothetical protein IPL99_12275 [Candidatus Competibacteraceae bacterium]|nr:hypothetical protein [Candidatus Competibacteraceae bacterium]